MEEKLSDCETMKRENRRVAAMSWGAGDDMPPPKPSRIPQTDSSSMQSLGENSTTPQTYIVAQNAAVLAQLMRENESRPFNVSAYNTPATVFNTLGVHIDATENEPAPSEMPTLRTVMLPASELLKLNPITNENSQTFATNIYNPDEPTMTFVSEIESKRNVTALPVYPIPCEIIKMESQQVHLVDSMYKEMHNPQNNHYSQNLPCDDLVVKSRSLERNAQLNVTYATRISSLDRIQSSSHLKQTRSNSLTRQLSSGNEISTTNIVPNFMDNTRSTSLERGVRTNNYAFRTNSFDCGNEKRINMDSDHGCIERNQSVGKGNYKMLNTQNLSFGSMERSRQGTEIVPYLKHRKARL